MYRIPGRDDYKSYKTIDLHTHTGTDLSLAAQSEREHIASDIEVLLKSMDYAGIDKAVTFNQPIPAGKHAEYNYELSKDVALFGKKRIIQFAFLNPWEKNAPSLLEDLIRNYGVKGLKLHPLFDKYPENYNKIIANETIPTFDVANKYNLPVIIHSGWGVRVESILELAKEFPHMQVGVLHLMENVFPCASYDNVFVETSYASTPRRIRQVVDKLGSERVVFGSDYAWSDQLVEKIKVLRLPLPEKDVQNILYRNAERILGLDREDL